MRDMGNHSIAVGEIYDPYAAGGAAGIGVARARSMRLDPGNPAFNQYAIALQEGGSPYPQFMGPRDTYGAAGAGGAGGPFGRGSMGLGATVIPSGQQQPQRSPPPQDYTTLGRSKSNSTADTHLSTPSQSHTPNYSQPQSSYPVRQMSPPRPTPTPAVLPTPYSPVLPNPYNPVIYPTSKVEPSRESADDVAYGGYVVDDDDADEEEAPRRVLKVRYYSFFLFLQVPDG